MRLRRGIIHNTSSLGGRSLRDHIKILHQSYRLNYSLLGSYAVRNVRMEKVRFNVLFAIKTLYTWKKSPSSSLVNVIDMNTLSNFASGIVARRP